MRSLLLALAPAALAQDAADCDMAAAIVEPEQPVVLAAFQASMALYLDPASEPAEMVTARNNRKTTRETYDPRRMVAPSWIPGELSMYELADIFGITTENCELEGSCPDTISARFCGLDYPECPAHVQGEWPPEALVCAGVEPGNRTCGSAEITTYGIGVLLPGATPVVLGIVLMVIWMLWWMLRFVGCCCGFGFCGGCKPGKAKFVHWLLCGYVSYPKKDNKENQPDYVTDPRSCCSQLGIFRMWFILVFCLCILSGVISFVGNGSVGPGINDALDVGMYDLKQLAFDVDQIFTQLQTITNGTEAEGTSDMLPAGLRDQVQQFSCFVESKQDEVDKVQDEYLEYREWGTLAVIAIPVVLSVFYMVCFLCEMCCKTSPCWAQNCLRLNSVLVWLLVIVVCISAAAHLILTLVFADICYEFDLHLAKYTMDDSPLFGTAENLNFLPEEAKGFCGEDGELAFMEDEFNTQMEREIQAGCDLIVQRCNNAETQGFMDCSAVSFLTGTAPAYSASVPAGGASEYNGYLAEAPDQLMITDVDLTQVADTDLANFPNKVKNCLADIGAAPYTDSGWDATCSEPTYSGCSADEQEALTGWESTPPTGAEVERCFIDTHQVTARECAASCSMDDAKTQAAEVVGSIDDATSTFTAIYTLFDDDVRPLLQCTFVSEVISDLFYPLCVDAFGGFTWIVAGHIVSLVVLLLSFPIGIMSTKRFVVHEDGLETGSQYQM